MKGGIRMFSEKYSLYFINEYHEENYGRMLQAFPQAKEYSDYRCAIYIVSLPEVYNKIDGKVGQYPFVWVNAVEEVLVSTYDEETGKKYVSYDIKVLWEKDDGSPDYSNAYNSLSSSYQSIVKLGEELFGGTYNGFELMDAIADFDDSLYKVFMQLLKIRRSKYDVRGLIVEIV